MVTDLARDFHDTKAEVTWDPRREPWNWTGQVTPLMDDETDPSPGGKRQAKETRRSAGAISAYGPEMDIVSGVVSIAYSHFYIAEYIEQGFESVDDLPDFHTDEPVIVTPGKLTIVSCVQEHKAWVTLMLAEAQPVQQAEQWQSLGSWPYRPVYRGRMGISGPTTGPAVPAAGWLPGSQGYAPTLTLHPAAIYTVHVYARGRKDSRARYEAAMTREEWGLNEGFEDYVAIFIPAGEQAGPQAAG